VKSRSRTWERVSQGGGTIRPAIEALEDRCLLSATYDVGPGQSYATIGAVPWESLGPGDTVRIHWQAQAYHEKIRISASGTSDQPIQIIGVAGPSGQLPVIDGSNATTRPQDVYRYAPTQDRGLLTITPSPGQPYGYIPSYIDIEGLDLQDAYAPWTFTDASGAVRTYANNAAALYVERGQHLVINDCTLTGSGNGLFVGSGSDSASLSEDILVENCDIFGNGTVGSYREHNVYTEAIGIVFQYNHLGLPRPGSQGNNLKDRSAGTVIRYNWIEGGGHMLDLVDPQDSAWATVQADGFHQTYVYGNVFINGPGAQGATYLVHYGGDDSVYANYRKGTLYFYNNTVVNQADQTGAGARWRTILLQLDTNDESADVRNNILFNEAATPGATATELDLMNTAGNADFGVNWVSPDWQPYRSGLPFTGTISGTSNFLVDPANDPGFVNLADGDVRLVSGSAAVDAGEALTTDYPVDRQYLDPQSGTDRPVVGSAPDLGAFEWGTPSGTALRLTTDAAAVTAGGSVAVTVSAYSGDDLLPSYTGTVHFLSSDPQAGLPANYTFTPADAGTHTFLVSLKTAMSQTIWVTDTDGVQAAAHVYVQPGQATSVVVIGRPSSAVNYPFSVAVVVEDSFGNAATGYAGTVHLSSTDAAAVLPADYTFTAADQGVHLFNVTLASGGRQTIRAADTAVASLAGSLQVAVTPVTHFAISLPASAVAGSPFTFTVLALDQNGNVVPDYTGTIHFTTTDSYILPPPDYTFTAADRGAHTFTLAFRIAGTQTITVTDTAYGGLTGHASVAVNPGSVTGFKIIGAATTSAGAVVQIQVVAVDRDGNTVTGYTGSVNFTSTDGAADLPAAYAFVASDQGSHTFSVNLRTTGTQRITARDSATSSILGELAVTVD
jgi:hypothetical protein